MLSNKSNMANKKSTKRYSNKKKQQNITHPYIECIQTEITELQEKLKTFEEQELTAEQEQEKLVATSCLEHYQDTLNKMNDSIVTNKVNAWNSTIENNAKKREQHQVLTLLQLFYLMRLGQLGLFQYIEETTVVPLNIISDICDQIIGASVYHAKEHSLKIKSQHKNKVFDLMKKLDSSSEELTSENSQTTFKQVKDFLLHLWENTSPIDKNEINQQFSIVQFDSMMPIPPLVTANDHDEPIPILSNSTTTHEETTVSQEEPIVSPEEITVSSKEEATVSPKEEETMVNPKEERQESQEEETKETNVEDEKFQDAEKEEIVEPKNTSSNETHKEKEEHVTLSNAHDALSKINTSDEWSKVDTKEKEQESPEKKKSDWKGNEETKEWTSFDTTLKNDGWGDPDAHKETSSNDWDELKKKFDASDIEQQHPSPTYETREGDWRRNNDHTSRGRGRGGMRGHSRGRGFRGNNSNFRGKPRGGMSRGRGDEEYKPHRRYSSSRQHQE